MSAPAAVSEDPIAFWNGRAADRWTRDQARLDLSLRPFGDAAMRAAAVKPGERVVDVGCGCGDTTIALAAQVGSSGHVLGVDVSAPMLARAGERSAHLANVTYVEQDATLLDATTRANALFSRFGVMFFATPERTFKALAGALAPGGRIAFVCWRAFADNPW
ncbi:MAG: class I SAM-dependent methyltransferase, partial [Polyangiales bacterium]